VTLQLDVPVMFLLPETAPLQDVTSICVELVGVSSTNKTTLDVDILGCSKGKTFDLMLFFKGMKVWCLLF